METIGISDYGIAYTAIPRCANTSLKLSLLKLKTGKDFEGYLGSGPIWPHSTSSLEVHRNDISEFDHLSDLDGHLIEMNYNFWFTVVDNPLRRLFSSYYMFILLEDPHLKVMRRDYFESERIKKISYHDIRKHFEEFVTSKSLENLMLEDVHFMPQSELLKNLISCKSLRFYSLNEINKVESDINRFLDASLISKKFLIPKKNTSIINLGDIEISKECCDFITNLYKEDFIMLENKGLGFSNVLTTSRKDKDEILIQVSIQEIRDRNRRILAMYEKHKEILESSTNLDFKSKID